MGVITSAAAIGSTLLGAAAGTVTFATVSVGLAAQLAVGVALWALSPKPQGSRLSGVGGAGRVSRRGYDVSSKGAALDHQIIYGRVKLGGAIVFQQATGNNNKYLHNVIAFAGHEIEEFEGVYFDDELLTIDGNGEVTAPAKYVGKARVNFHLGGDNQTADSDLVAEVPDWTTSHRLRGIAYLYIRLQFDADSFPNGVPNISATIKGKKLYDPRDGNTVWSDNPALALRDYLTNSRYGLGEASANIDDTLVSTAANVCEQTDTLNGEAWFTCNGAFTTGITPYELLTDLLTSMGGLLWYSQGKWKMRPAYWTSPVLELTEDDLRSSVNLKTRHSRRDNFNTVKGTFRGDESDWQETDYPPVTNESFVNADNGQESVVDLELPYTDNSEEARRIARIFLERNRQQLTVEASFGMRAFAMQVGDVVTLTLDRFGWSSKTFEIVGWTFGLQDDSDLQVNATLREISESVFDEVDDGEVYERDNTSLLDPFEVPSLGLSADAITKIIKEKLVNILTVNVTSGRPEGIDFVEVQFKKESESEWKSGGTGELGLFEILDLEDDTYDIRARAINTFGVRGSYTTLEGVEASGLSDPPSDVTDFFEEVSGGVLTLNWSPVPDLDLSYYKIRFNPNNANASWANSLTYVDKVPRPGSSITVSGRAGTFLIRAYDKSGVASENFSTLEIPASALPTYITTLSQTEETTFSGSKTNLSVVSNELRLTSYATADSEGEYVFSNYIDAGSSVTARVYVDVNLTRVADSNLFDDAPGLFDSTPGDFDDASGDVELADTNVITYISTTDDDPSGTPTWSDYKVFKVGDFPARAFRFKVKLLSTADGVTPSIVNMTAYVKHN